MEELEINWPIAITLLIYGLFMFGVSLFLMRKVKKAVDLLMGGRGLPMWVQLGTYTATGVGTGVTIGAAGLAYSSGWAGAVYPIGIGLGIIASGVFFAHMRKYKFMTLSEEISSFYGGNRYVYEYINITLFISQVFWMTVQIMGGGFMLSVILGLHPNKCMIIAGILIASTSLPGGLMTVVFTDVLQAIILIIGFCILTAVTLGETGGLAALHNMVPEGYVSFMGVDEIGWAGALSIFLALGLSIVADPGRRLILYGGKTVKGGRRAMIGAGLIEIAFSPLVVIAGMYAYSLNPDLLEQDQALPWLITDILPTWLAAILVVSITAAVFSSGNTNGATSCTYFMRHIYPLIMGRYPKRPLMVSRLVLLGVIIVSTVMALYAGTIVSFVADFLSALMSGPAIIVLVGRFWRRATWQGALAGLIATLIVSIFVIVIPSLREYFVRPVIPAAVVGLVTEIIVSLITPRNQIQFEDVVTKMSDQRIGIDDYEGD